MDTGKIKSSPKLKISLVVAILAIFGFFILNSLPNNFIFFNQLASALDGLLGITSTRVTSTGFSSIGIVSDVSANTLSISDIKSPDKKYTFDTSSVTKIESKSYQPLILSDINIGDKVIVQGLNNSGDITLRRIISFGLFATSTTLASTSVVIASTTLDIASSTSDSISTTSTTTDSTQATSSIQLVSTSTELVATTTPVENQQASSTEPVTVEPAVAVPVVVPTPDPSQVTPPESVPADTNSSTQ